MKLGKSKLALAKAINENGGWSVAGDCNFVTSNRSGVVKFFNQNPLRNGADWVSCPYSLSWIDLHQQLPNWHQTVLSREEYYQAYPKADADGWIEWKGGECPVDGGDQVDYKLLSGSVVTIGEIAGYLEWSHEFSTANIIAYRLHKPDVKPEFCESVTHGIPGSESIEELCAKVTEENKHQHVDATTIEQLAMDYRNAKEYADRLQKEADEAAKSADARLGELERAGEVLGLLIGIAKQDREPELVTTDWRDLKVGDEVECTEYDPAHRFGVVCRIDESSEEQPIMVNHGDGEGISWPSSWKFIRRP